MAVEAYAALSLSLLAQERAAEVAENVTAGKQLSLSRPTSTAVLHTLTVASQKVRPLQVVLATQETCGHAGGRFTIKDALSWQGVMQRNR